MPRTNHYGWHLHRETPGLLRGEERIYRLPTMGDAMRPAFQPGDTLLVEPAGPAFSADGVYLIRLETSYNVKRVQQTKDGILIISDNDAYDNYIMPPDADWEILARVRGRYR